MTREDVVRWQRQHIGIKPNGDLKWGEQCDVCHITEWGAKRSVQFGLEMKPCPKCPDSIQRILGGF